MEDALTRICLIENLLDIGKQKIHVFISFQKISEITRGSGLLGSKITLLPFGNLEERVGNGFGLTTHCANIQETCISVQSHI